MSNRTLIEINHDFAGEIDREDTQFVIDLVAYLRAGGERAKENLQQYGIRVLGTRHHSDGFCIKWGHNDPIKQETR